ncbi:MAG: hypothetical protein JXX29_10385 [Deltaproteobacteria bacterium]|nr:hypothetical protein [Deltaproteobacteria bacterium]MBN2672074.1 hypothetical protein [Deltaproteobacteria bacterium]
MFSIHDSADRPLPIRFDIFISLVVRRLTSRHFVFLALWMILGCAPETGDVTSLTATPADGVVSHIRAAATSQYMLFLNRIPVGQESEYGFDERAEFERVQVGTPLPMFTVDIDTTGATPTVSNRIRALDEWRVPLLIDGKRRALLTVAKSGGGWQVVDFGAVNLAESLNVLDQMGSIHTPSSRYLLRVFAMRRDFLGGANASGEEVFYPVFGAEEKPGSGAASGVTSLLPNAFIERPLTKSELLGWIQENVKGGAR